MTLNVLPDGSQPLVTPASRDLMNSVASPEDLHTCGAHKLTQAQTCTYVLTYKEKNTAELGLFLMCNIMGEDGGSWGPYTSCYL